MIFLVSTETQYAFQLLIFVLFFLLLYKEINKKDVSIVLKRKLINIKKGENYWLYIYVRIVVIKKVK